MNLKKTLGLASLALTTSLAHAATLNIETATDWGGSHSSYPASKTIDGSLAWASRWAASGSPVNLQLDLGSVQSVSSVGISWGKGGDQTHSFEIWARATTSDSWTKVRPKGDTTGTTSSIESYDIDDINAQYVRIKTHSNSAGSTWTNIKEVEIYGDEDSGTPTTPPAGNLDPNKAPSENFDLSKWYLSVPIDRGDGNATSIDVNDLNAGYESSTYFYTGSDGGMVFVNYPKDAPKTSANTTYSRTELREMLYGDDASTKDAENNWFFSTSNNVDSNAGGIDGTLNATLAVNRVTTTSDSTSQVGRVIVGQIHASSNEPNRLYFHKQPGHSKGAIYVAHETKSGDEVFYNIIGDYVVETGSKAGDYSGASSPSDGIALGEKFSYEIKVIGNEQWVTISREGKSDVTKYIDMSNSDYENDWMYFKAGIYSQNKTVSSSSDHDKVTFYALEQSHN